MSMEKKGTITELIFIPPPRVTLRWFTVGTQAANFAAYFPNHSHQLTILDFI